MWSNLRSFLRYPPSFSTGIAFAVMSLLFGTWITRIPDIQIQADLSEGELGLALLGMPIGAIITMPFLGAVISRWGTGRATFYAALLYCAVMMLPGFSSNWWSLTLSLLLVGSASGAMDVAMNAMAAAIEKKDKLAIMSTCHAFFSFGGMIGAGLASLMAGFGLEAKWHLVGMSGLMLLVSVWQYGLWLKIEDPDGEGHHWALPSKSVLLLAGIGFCVLLAEGAIADWSAVYLKNTLNGSAFISGLGFAGFSFSMALGRLYGDIFIPKLGGRRLLIGGGFLAAGSMGLALIVNTTWALIAGFTLAGLGLSCIVPIIFSAGARAPGISAGSGIAAIASMGYVGFMVGPPAIGMLAELCGLRWGMVFIAMITLVIALISLGMRAKKV